MKHGKNPTVRQKKYLTSLGLNHENWLVCQDTPVRMVLTHKHTGLLKVIDKSRCGHENV